MKKVLLIYGGTSSEHDVSCLSAKSIIENIDLNKYNLECVEITKNNEWISDNKIISNIIDYLKSFDVIFPITHGTGGEDGKLQGMLDLFNVKYVGSKTGPSYICMDKEFTKYILKYHNIPQVPFEIYNKKLNLDFPVIIKPANGGSSIGINIANNKKEFKSAIREAKKYDNKVIIEKFINAQELECAVLKNKRLIVSKVGEILPANKFYDFDAKYNKDSTTLIPANIDSKISNQIKEYARKIFKVLNLSNFARIDFFYDKDNDQIYFNEVNTLPGFTEISMFPQLIMHEGYTYKEIITMLIENSF